jgi:hypothetical protein
MRGMSIVLFTGCSLLPSACASLAPEQPRTLMREIERPCVSQFPDMAVQDVTSFGLLIHLGFLPIVVCLYCPSRSPSCIARIGRKLTFSS